MNPLFQVGKGGLNEEMLYQIGEALEKRELLKIALLQNTDEETDAVAAVIEENCERPSSNRSDAHLYCSNHHLKKKIVVIRLSLKKSKGRPIPILLR